MRPQPRQRGRNDAIDDKAAREPVAQRHPVEALVIVKRRVAAVVEETLGIEHISVNEDLFTLGAHSLMMVQLKSRLDADFGGDIPILDLFQNSTVNGIAAVISESSAQRATVDLGVSRARLRRELRSRRPRRAMT